MAHSNIYREQLAGLYRGYSLWEPGANGQYDPVDIGDVGFIQDGRFCRLFNVYLPADHPSQTRGVPQGFERLAPGHKDRQSLARGDYCSASVSDAGLDVGTQIARCALLLTHLISPF